MITRNSVSVPKSPVAAAGPFRNLAVMALKKLAKREASRIGRRGRRKETAV